MLKTILILFCIFFVVYAKNATSTHQSKCAKKNCANEFQSLDQCLKDASAKNEAQIRQRFKEKKSDLEMCFKNNKCALPARNEAKDQKSRECLHKRVKAVEKCVQENLDQPLPDSLMSSSNGTEKLLFYPDQMCGSLNDSCKSQSSRISVLQCANSVFQNETQILKKDSAKDCEANKQCLSKLSKDCLCQVEEVNEAILACIIKLIRTKNKEYLNLPECEEFDQEASDPLCQKSPPLKPPTGQNTGTVGWGGVQIAWSDSNATDLKVSCNSFENYKYQHYTYGGN